MTVVWDVTPCSPIETEWRSQGAYYLSHHAELFIARMKAVSASETSDNS